MKKGQAVLVTTIHRGVFFGYADALPKGKTITIKNARNCIYWSADVKGFLGLAESGPTQCCRIGPRAKSLILNDVTSVAEVSEAAIQKWESAPWSM